MAGFNCELEIRHEGPHRAKRPAQDDVLTWPKNKKAVRKAKK